MPWDGECYEIAMESFCGCCGDTLGNTAGVCCSIHENTMGIVWD